MLDLGPNCGMDCVLISYIFFLKKKTEVTLKCTPEIREESTVPLVLSRITIATTALISSVKLTCLTTV